MESYQQEKPEISHNTILSTTNLILIGNEPSFWGERPVINRLNHGKAQEDHDLSVLILSSNLATRLSRWASFQTKIAYE